METPPATIGEIRKSLTQFKDEYFTYACDALSRRERPEFPEDLIEAFVAIKALREKLHDIQEIVDISSKLETYRWISGHREVDDKLSSYSGEKVRNACNLLRLAHYSLSRGVNGEITPIADLDTFLKICLKALTDTPRALSGIIEGYLKNTPGLGAEHFEPRFGVDWAVEVGRRVDSYTRYFNQYYAMGTYLALLRRAFKSNLQRQEEFSTWRAFFRNVSRLKDERVPELASTLETYSFLVEWICRFNAMIQVWDKRIYLKDVSGYYLSESYMGESTAFIKAVRGLQNDNAIFARLYRARESLIDLAAHLGARLFGMNSIPIDIKVSLSDSDRKIEPVDTNLRVLYNTDENGRVCGFLPLFIHDPRFIIRIPKEPVLQLRDDGRVVTDIFGWPMLYFNYQFVEIVTGRTLYLNEIVRNSVPEHLTVNKYLFFSGEEIN